MPQKTRYPARLNLGDFISFIRELLVWLATQVGDPDYRATLVDGLQAKFDALEAKLAEYKQLDIHVPELNTLYTGAGKALHEGLSMLKTLLPSFYEDPDVLGEFALADPIPFDLDDLYIIARACFDRWADVSGDPEYAVVAPDFTNVEAKYNDFIAKRDEYEAKFGEMEAAQNDLLELRAAVEEQERDLFNYYRAKHPKGDDEFWTETPWGTTGGGGNGGEKLPVVENITLDYVAPDLTISWDAVEGATGYTLQMGNNPMILGTTLYVGPDTLYKFDPPGGHPHYFRVWAMDGETWGERGDAVSIEITGEKPDAPHNLKLTRDGVYVKAEWKTTDVPQHCTLYIEIVPTGSPEPTISDEPHTDEIITNGVSIFAPGAGNTVYAWVTAFHDGEESDPCGPVSIDIV